MCRYNELTQALTRAAPRERSIIFALVNDDEHGDVTSRERVHAIGRDRLVPLRGSLAEMTEQIDAAEKSRGFVIDVDDLHALDLAAVVTRLVSVDAVTLVIADAERREVCETIRMGWTNFKIIDYAGAA